MSKLRTGLLATGLAFGWLGCGDEIHYSGSDAAKGDPGVAGPAGGKGDKGDKGDPGAPATTNDHFMFQPKGTLQGVVYDQYDRKPIAGAKIHLNYLGMGMVTTVTTGSDGTYAFAGVPATAATGISHPTAGAMWMGVYSVVLELPDPTGAMDRQYRKYQERKAAVVFTDLGDGESAAGSDQNTDTQVDGLVANLDFPVRQLRAAVAGNVYNAEDRSPMGNFPMLLTYANGADNNGTQMGVPCPGTDQSAAGQTASNVTTDAMGAYMASGFEEGVCYTLRPVDDRFSFSGTSANAQGRYTGTPFYAPENGVVRRLSDILVQNNVGRDSVRPFVTTVTPGDETVQLAGAALDQNITITFNEPMDITKQANLATSLYWGLNDSGDKTFPCRGVDANPAAAASGQWGPTGVAATAMAKCRTLQEIPTIATWDMAQQVLTINPQTNFVPGLAYAYRLDLHNALLTDVAGNVRNGTRPASQTSTAGDAFQAGGGFGGFAAPDSIVFTFQAGANLLTVDACMTNAMTGARTGLCQEPDTADNQALTMGVGPSTRANIIEQRPGVTDHSFRDLLVGPGNGMYNNNMALGTAANATNNAYVRWTPVAGAVAYIMYFRSALYPNPQPLQKVFGGTPPRFATNLSIAGVNGIMGMVYNDNPNTPTVNEAFITLNTQWDNNLSFELGLSAVNVDGDEGPITFLTVKDNTTPEMAQMTMSKPAGADWNFVNGAAVAGNNDSVVLDSADWTGCVGASTCNPTMNPGTTCADKRISCQSVAQTGYHSLLASSYGLGTVIIQLSEPVSAASIVTTAFSYQNGFVRNDVGNTTDPNGAETDPTITGVAAVGAAEGKTDLVAVNLSNIFLVDSGDWIALSGSGGALTDLAGNAAAAATSSGANAEAPSFKFVDNISPMIRAVTVVPSATAAAGGDAIGITFTKRVFLEDELPVAVTTNGNYNTALVNFAGASRFFPTLAQATDAAGGTTIFSANLATSAGGDDSLTYNLADVSWLADDTRINLAGVHNIDWFKQSPAGVGSRSANTTDDGREAYVNFRVETGGVPAGAYAPNASNVGTRDTQQDTVGPRLSLRDADRGPATVDFNNSVQILCPVAPATNVAQNGFAVRVTLTDAMLNDGSAAAANTAANWTVTFRDFGGCGGGGPACAAIGWNGTVNGQGNAGTNPEAFSAAIQSVVCAPQGGGTGGTVCTLTYNLQNQQQTTAGDCATATTRIFAVDTVTLSATVRDCNNAACTTGNTAAVGGRTYTFSTNRNAAAAATTGDVNPANDGWIRS